MNDAVDLARDKTPKPDGYDYALADWVIESDKVICF